MTLGQRGRLTRPRRASLGYLTPHHNAWHVGVIHHMSCRTEWSALTSACAEQSTQFPADPIHSHPTPVPDPRALRHRTPQSPHRRWRRRPALPSRSSYNSAAEEHLLVDRRALHGTPLTHRANPSRTPSWRGEAPSVTRSGQSGPPCPSYSPS